MKKIIIYAVLISLGYLLFSSLGQKEESLVLSYEVNLEKQNLQFFLKNESGEYYNTFYNLKKELENKDEELVFAMNGGMFMKDYTPLGLYIENGVEKHKINKTQEAFGNFYMQPNGIFYITEDKKGVVCKSTDFENKNIQYATQSGPMLVIDGKLHPKFNEGSKNLNIRNGVGILPNGNVLFAMSKKKINFYDFAQYFKKLGCKNALYLDGFVSRTYLPSKGYKTNGGKFGVIIGVVK
ncbi:MAG: phosphodiester glycosidase family protein [Flavobacteriales bacterium]|nr:phosphodiester glycosidase family protein [Flavobacteriales bacterium]